MAGAVKVKRKPSSGGVPGRPIWPYPHVVTLTAYGHRGRERWGKVFRGRTYTFAAWDEPDKALAAYMEQWPAITGGLEVVAVDQGDDEHHRLTLRDLANRWLADKLRQVEAGTLAPETRRKYQTHIRVLMACRAVNRHMYADDLRAERWAKIRDQAAAGRGLYYVQDFIITIRSMYKWAHACELIDAPMRFGPGFIGSTERQRQIHRAGAASRIYTAAQVRLLVEMAGPHLRPCILLGINAGLKARDIGVLETQIIDFDKGLILTPRHKTGFAMTVALWPETVDAIKAVCDPGGLACPTEAGWSWDDGSSHRLAVAFRELKARVNQHIRDHKLDTPEIRKEQTHMYLRHNFRTVAAEVDRDAAKRMMGQRLGDALDAHYDHGNWADRCREVAEHVRQWYYRGWCSDWPGEYAVLETDHK